MEKPGDLSDFECTKIVGSLSISQTADLLGFSQAAIEPQNGLNNGKYPVSGNSLFENTLLMTEVRGECPDYFKLIGRKRQLK